MSVVILDEMLKFTLLSGLSLAGILIILMWTKSSNMRISYLRFFVQFISQIAIFTIISYSLWLSLVLAVIFLLTFLVGRFFCGWICPFGFYMDIITLVRKAFKKRYLTIPDRLNKALHNSRYVILLVFLILPLFFAVPMGIGVQLFPSLLFLAGPFNPLRILLAPLVPVVAPWKLLYDSNLNFPYLDQIVHYSSVNFTVINVVVFLAFTLVSSFLVRRFWCRFCPTGASFAVLNRFRVFKWAPALHISKQEEKCTKCGICQRVCHLQVTEVYGQKGGEIKTSMCMLCFRCVEMCPQEGCLKIKIYKKAMFESKNWLEPHDSE